MQFEIPAEMLQGMFGMGGGQQRGPPPTEWPKSESSEIEKQYEFLINTEWKGRTAKYLLRREGVIESPLKECQREGMCLWAANKGRILMNTPTLKVVKFTVDGLDKADRKLLDQKDEKELKKIKLISEKASKSGKKSELMFERLDIADDKEVIGSDLYKVLEVEPTADQGAIKSKYRKLSIKHHPDKGGDPKVFNEIRDAYEVLQDQDQRRYYDMGGIQLVKNMETAFKELEGKKAQLDAQLNQIPKHHPQYNGFKAQINQQKAQLDKKHAKHDVEKQMRSDKLEVLVPISSQELVRGAAAKPYEFKRLVLCRGCRADPESPECADCGRCPPEKVQVPKYANTPFGKQVVGMSEREQESRERCREMSVQVKLKVTKGAKDGKTLATLSDIGHQIPGKLPGQVEFKCQRGVAANDTHTPAETDLHTVLHVSLEQALFGFKASWTHLDGEQVVLERPQGFPLNEVVRFRKMGIPGEGGGARGDLFVRIAVDLPEVQPSAPQAILARPATLAELRSPRLEAEAEVYLHDGKVYRRWLEREHATPSRPEKSKGKQEL